MCHYKNFRTSTDATGIVFITGAEGVGKSSLATQFCHQIRDSLFHTCIFLDGESHGGMLNSILRLEEQCNLNLSDASVRTDKHSASLAVKIIKAVHTLYKNIPIVLFIDNLHPNNVAVKTLLLSLASFPFPRIFVVLTATYPNLPGFVYKEISLKVFSREIKPFLQSCLNRDEIQPKEINALVENGGLHPLTLSMVVKSFKVKSEKCGVNQRYHLDNFTDELSVGKETRNSNVGIIQSFDLLSKTVGHAFIELGSDKRLQDSAHLFLMILCWLVPINKADLSAILDIFDCLDPSKTKQFLLSEVIIKLEELGLVTVEPFVLNLSTYNHASIQVKKYVEIHPAVRKLVQANILTTCSKYNLAERLITQFGRLSEPTILELVNLQEELLENFVEYNHKRSRKSSSLYYELKKVLTIAENPKEIYVTWIRWLIVVSGYNFLYTLTTTISVALYILLTKPEGFDLFIIVLFIIAYFFFFLYCVVVCYVGTLILRNSTKMLKK
ncbi:uncharacterized protein LOC118438365 [Folsomia candida]|uniref:uncharacterized protein LOC118438365 n=1 Tax=Folsomia candida TaxID=158441 RepID=UPI0016051B38|nr:uncharacterized protein LOC118438365 [Folsomia candida]